MSGVISVQVSNREPQQEQNVNYRLKPCKTYDYNLGGGSNPKKT